MKFLALRNCRSDVADGSSNRHRASTPSRRSGSKPILEGASRAPRVRSGSFATGSSQREVLPCLLCPASGSNFEHLRDPRRAVEVPVPSHARCSRWRNRGCQGTGTSQLDAPGGPGWDPKSMPPVQGDVPSGPRLLASTSSRCSRTKSSNSKVLNVIISVGFSRRGADAALLPRWPGHPTSPPGVPYFPGWCLALLGVRLRFSDTLYNRLHLVHEFRRDLLDPMILSSVCSGLLQKLLLGRSLDLEVTSRHQLRASETIGHRRSPLNNYSR